MQGQQVQDAATVLFAALNVDLMRSHEWGDMNYIKLFLTVLAIDSDVKKRSVSYSISPNLSRLSSTDSCVIRISSSFCASSATSFYLITK